MEQLIWVSLFILLLIFLNKKMNHIEGYTNCNKQPALRLFSIHFNQQFGELSILNNLDLANRAYRANIPLKTIRLKINVNIDCDEYIASGNPGLSANLVNTAVLALI